MTEHLEIAIEPGFVHAVSTNKAHSASIQGIFAEVADAAPDAGVSRIVFDASSAKDQLNIVQRYDYASLAAEQFRGFNVAFVVNQSLRDPDLFGETVAVNRGGYIRVFTTLLEAYEWLEVQPSSKSTGVDDK